MLTEFRTASIHPHAALRLTMPRKQPETSLTLSTTQGFKREVPAGCKKAKVP